MRCSDEMQRCDVIQCSDAMQSSDSCGQAVPDRWLLSVSGWHWRAMHLQPEGHSGVTPSAHWTPHCVAFAGSYLPYPSQMTGGRIGQLPRSPGKDERRLGREHCSVDGRGGQPVASNV
jgi:hypothetical protein